MLKTNKNEIKKVETLTLKVDDAWYRGNFRNPNVVTVGKPGIGKSFHPSKSK